MKQPLILAVNPGSTSTKIAVYQGESPLFETVLRHSREEMDAYPGMGEAMAFRRGLVKEALAAHGVEEGELAAVIGRGGLIRPVAGGAYRVNDAMAEDLLSCQYGSHASNLGGLIARTIGEEHNIPALIADPPVVDELCQEARISGYPDISRISIFHALNQKAVAKRYCAGLGKSYEQTNLIVAHMGGGVSVGAHKNGRVIDVNDALGGDGPFSAERAGGLPAAALVRLCFSGQYDSAAQAVRALLTKGGLYGYLGTNDGREVSARIAQGDEKAALVYKSMAFQIARVIGAWAASLGTGAEAVILTGGFAYDTCLTGWIQKRVEHLAPVIVMPGEDELRALAEAALRVLRGQEEAMEY